jgi:5-hydroxyisourate hydrolase-like protein (transthyretin family)
MIQGNVSGKQIENSLRVLLSFTTILTTISASAGVRQATATRTIEVIVNTAEGAPVADATVTLTHTPPQTTDAISNSTSLSGTSDAEGHAAFRNLAEGVYSIRAEHQGYYPTHAGGAVVWFGLNPSTAAASSPISENRQVRMILTKGGTIAGHVQDAQGRPVINASVIPMHRTYQDGEVSLARVEVGTSTRTNDLGEYRLFWLPPGEYFLRIDKQYPITIANYFNAPTYYPGTLISRSATPITLSEGQNLARIDVTIPDIKGVTVSGKIVNLLPALNGPQAAANGLPLRLLDRGSLIAVGTGLAEDPTFLLGSIVSIESESPFELRGVPPGEYDFYPVLIDRSSGKPQGYTGRTRILVDNADVTGVVATVGIGTSVRGRRTFVDGKPALQQSIQISLIALDSLPTNGSFRQPRTFIEDGMAEFAVSGVVEGSYRLAPVQGLADDDYIADVRVNGGSVSGDGIINVPRDGVVDLDLVIGRNGGMIEGTLEPPSGSMPVAVTVILVPDLPRRGNTSLYQMYNLTLTPPSPNAPVPDGLGSFSFFAVAPGNYKVFAWEDFPRRGAEWNREFIAKYEGRGVPVVVRQGAQLDGVRVPIIRAP